MKYWLLLALLFSSVVSADDQGQDRHVHWIAPTQNVDGTPLADLAGFKLYYGPTTGNYTVTIDITDPLVTEWDIPDTSTLYVAITAIDADNNESAYSNEVVKLDPQGQVPMPPVLL